MMHKPWQISRRTALKGFGTAVALPLLDAMLPATAYTAFGRAAQAAEAAKKTPNRMAFLYVPNGIHMPDWTPEKVGADFELPPTLKLLEKFKQDFLVLSGLAQDGARPHGDGGGDHARAMASFLTGCHPRKTHGADIKAGVSADQVAAQRIGQLTRFSSLELGCEAGAQNGNCDSGYSCAYSSNSSWKTESTPLAKEVNPRLVFERLFCDGASRRVEAARQQRIEARKSVLDFALEDARQLKQRLGATRSAQARRVPRHRPRDRAPDQSRRAGFGRRAAELRQASRRAQGLRRTHSADVRPAGAGFPERPDADQHLRAGQRRQQQELPVHRRSRRAPQPLASRQRQGKAGQDQQDQPVPHHAVRATCWKS